MNAAAVMDSKRLKQVIGDYFNSNAKNHNTRVLYAQTGEGVVPGGVFRRLN